MTFSFICSTNDKMLSTIILKSFVLFTLQINIARNCVYNKCLLWYTSLLMFRTIHFIIFKLNNHNFDQSTAMFKALYSNNLSLILCNVLEIFASSAKTGISANSAQTSGRSLM